MSKTTHIFSRRSWRNESAALRPGAPFALLHVRWFGGPAVGKLLLQRQPHLQEPLHTHTRHPSDTEESPQPSWSRPDDRKRGIRPVWWVTSQEKAHRQSA